MIKPYVVYYSDTIIYYNARVSPSFIFLTNLNFEMVIEGADTGGGSSTGVYGIRVSVHNTIQPVHMYYLMIVH